MQFRHLILDRDGVMIAEAADGSYLTRPDDMRWIPGALDALAAFEAGGIEVSVATNQSAVGRGLMSRETLEAMHGRLLAEAAAAGGRIARILSCPHAPDDGCSCRKPAPGLIDAAVLASGLPAEATLVVGDAARDIEAAHAAGVEAALVRTGKGAATEPALGGRADVGIFDDLPALARYLAELPGRILIRKVFDDHLRVLNDAAQGLAEPLLRVAMTIGDALARGNKLIACGNGGSAADAEHLVAELVGRFSTERQALPALTLAAGPATVTALANDYGFERVFARQVEGLARPGDVLLAISTSGNSPNVLAAAQAARKSGCLVVGMTGSAGGALRDHADLMITAPSKVTARIQEVHGLCVHAIADYIDQDVARRAGSPT
jgi:D-sedoheptulose 7-phosphate isomerase